MKIESMEFSDILNLEGKIAFADGVSQIRTLDGSLLIKHDNRLIKISTKSNLDDDSKLFRILQRPKKFKDILRLLHEFKRNDVVKILNSLYKLNLITFETTKEKKVTQKDEYINSRYQLSYHTRIKGKQQPLRPGVLLIGNGILANKLILQLRNMNIKINHIRSVHALSASRKSGNQTSGKRNKDAPSHSDNLLSNKQFDESDLIIVAEDYPNIALFESVNSACFKKKKAWIRISFDDNLGYIGPLVIPRKTSCFNCCELRLVANSPYYEYELWKNKENIPITKSTLPVIFADILSSTCAIEVRRYFTNPNLPDTLDNIIVFDTTIINFTKHKIISHPNCIFCYPPMREKRITKPLSFPEDIGVGTTRVSLNDLPRPNSFSEDELLMKLRDLKDDTTGLILKYETLYENSKLNIFFHHFAITTCSKPLRLGRDGQLIRPVIAEDSLISPVPTGSGFSTNQTEIRALMESVERYSNMVLDESRLVWSNYENVQKFALNPKDLGLYSEEQYYRKDFACSRFSVHSEIPWVWGHEVISGSPVLVPADFVYYPAIRKMPLVFDTSNGSSAHTDTVQAILNGLFEVIERDSFLTMWLNKVSMPVLNIKKFPVGFTEPINLIHKYGLDLKLVNLTNDSRVTAIMAVCYNKNPKKYPALVVGSGAHTDPDKAIQKALFEMEFGVIEALENPQKKKVNNPDEISTIFENSRYYLNPNKRKYWEFMISGKETDELQSFTKKPLRNNHETLIQVAKDLNAMNHRVIWVDLTPHDMKKMGLVVVKVFVSGFQPLYVGNKRRLNLDRLDTVAWWLGDTIEKNRLSSELNSAPHPLP